MTIACSRASRHRRRRTVPRRGDQRRSADAGARQRTPRFPVCPSPACGRLGRVSGDLPVLGFGLPVSGRWATPDTMRRVARRAQAHGYASLWTFQRVLAPVARTLGPAHESVLDPIVALAHVAGHADRIRLGTATICAPFTAPALLAKALA